MASFLMQFDEGVPPAKLIRVDREPAECAMVAEALGEAAGRKVEIGVPQRGNRRRLLEQAVRNAGEELDRRLAESSSQAKLGRELAELFDLDEEPQSIERSEEHTSELKSLMRQSSAVLCLNNKNKDVQ